MEMIPPNACSASLKAPLFSQNVDKKKRGRRKKLEELEVLPTVTKTNNIQIEIQEVTPPESDKDSDISLSPRNDCDSSSSSSSSSSIPTFSTPRVDSDSTASGAEGSQEIVRDNPRLCTVLSKDEEETITKETQSIIKKRGRKPKGGKLIYKQPDQNTAPNSIANVILHLKCSLNDLTDYNHKISKLVTNPLEYNPTIPPDILTYNGESQAFSEYLNDSISGSQRIASGETLEKTIDRELIDQAYQETKRNNYICSLCKTSSPWESEEKKDENQEIEELDDSDINIKDINYKLKKLKINLYKNNHSEKKSACFWCTYEYDNPSCYIPKYDMDDKIYGYGSFCRPECAVAYLMKENLDDSTKFERYHLLNQIYSKVYDFKKNIKPAPNPYYLLDKFYGNLSIQEYRKLLKTEQSQIYLIQISL